MRGLGRASGTGVGLLALAAALVFGTAPAGAASALPPELVALEQQMSQLQVNSERFSLQAEIAVGGVVEEGAPIVLIFAGEGESNDSPPQSSIVGGLFGLPEEHTRVIGQTVYHYRRQAARVDGGRPWVSSPRPVKETDAVLDPGGLLEGDQPGAQGTFSKLIEELNGALSIEDSGPVTVDDQRVLEFDATLDPTPFLEQLKAKATKPKHPLKSLFEIPSVGAPKAPAKPTAPPALELEVFIAPTGVPVRVRVTFSDEGATIAVRLDTLAVNVPVDVAPPPPSKTISEAQLKALERRRAARERARALRACRGTRGKHAALCHVLATAPSAAPPSEPTLL